MKKISILLGLFLSASLVSALDAKQNDDWSCKCACPCSVPGAMSQDQICPQAKAAPSYAPVAPAPAVVPPAESPKKAKAEKPADTKLKPEASSAESVLGDTRGAPVDTSLAPKSAKSKLRAPESYPEPAVSIPTQKPAQESAKARISDLPPAGSAIRSEKEVKDALEQLDKKPSPAPMPTQAPVAPSATTVSVPPPPAGGVKKHSDLPAGWDEPDALPPGAIPLETLNGQLPPFVGNGATAGTVKSPAVKEAPAEKAIAPVNEPEEKPSKPSKKKSELKPPAEIPQPNPMPTAPAAAPMPRISDLPPAGTPAKPQIAPEEVFPSKAAPKAVNKIDEKPIVKAPAELVPAAPSQEPLPEAIPEDVDVKGEPPRMPQRWVE